jgi:hypothetical protein
MQRRDFIKTSFAMSAALAAPGFLTPLVAHAGTYIAYFHSIGGELRKHLF